MLLVPLLFCAAASSVMADRVLLVENESSPTSVEIADDYAARRGVKNIVKVHCQDSALDQVRETMPYADFAEGIQAPAVAYLAKHPKIDFIVLTKGIPIRLTGAPFGMGNTQPSLDSALACTGYESRKDVIPVTLNDSGFTGKCWVNRFWNSKERFSHSKFGGYLVTRLDGYTALEAKLLTVFSIQAERSRPTGPFLIDVAPSHGIGKLDLVPQNPAPEGKLDVKVINEMAYGDWDADEVVAGKKLQAKQVPVILELTDAFVGGRVGLAGYCSWGSNDPHFDAKAYATIRFDPGAIAETAVSTSGRTFLHTSGGQSLIADLIEGRVTGVKGYVDEPLLQAIASPSILFDRYTSGWTLAESFYAASRFVGWEDIVIGDPLCTPYGK